MKRKLIKVFGAIVILAGAVNISYGQFRWGIEAGVNASTQSSIGNIYDDDDLKCGYSLDITGKYMFNNWLALRSGVGYAEKGRKYETDDQPEISATGKFQYLSIPIKTEFSASEKAGFKNGQRLFFATGPYIGYLLDAEQKIQNKWTDINEANDFDWGWSAEFGFEFPVLKSGALRISANYDAGLTKAVSGSGLYNKTLSLRFGLLF